MKTLVRCKTCGFIIEEGKLGEVCPACGVPKKLFEPYTDKVSEKRRLILSLDIHPVIVHMPQAFSFSVFAFGLALLVLGGELRGYIQATVTVLVWCLPLVVLAAIASGLFDGKVRFKKLGTPLLKRKMVLGSAFFVCAAALLAITATGGFAANPGLVYWVIGLGLACLGCATLLGLIGTRLVHSAFPG